MRASVTLVALCAFAFFMHDTQAQPPRTWPAQTPASAAPSQEAKPPTLVLNQPVERELSAGQQHDYPLALSAGDFLYVVVEQVSVDAVVELFGPSDEKLAEADDPELRRGPESLFWLAEKAGTYRVRVRPYETKGRPGRYVARIAELRPGNLRDRTLIAATRAEAEAERLRVKATPETLERAVKKYDEALALWRELGDRGREAGTLHKQVRTLIASGRVADALPPARRALESLVAAHGQEGQQILPALFVLADLHERRSEYEEAQGQYERALRIVELGGGASSPSAADALFGVARALLARKDAAAALASYDKGLKIHEKNHGAESPAHLEALSQLVRIYDTLGRRDEARDLLRRVVNALSRQVGQEDDAFTGVLYSVAKVAAEREEHAIVQSLYERMIVLYRKLRGAGSRSEAGAESEMAQALSAQKKYAEARAAYERALKIYEGRYAEDQLTIANLHYGVASAAKSQGDYAATIWHTERAEKIYEQKRGAESEVVANLLTFKAGIYKELQDETAALAANERALKIYEKTEEPDSVVVAHVLSDIADLYSSAGDYAAARLRRDRALAIYVKQRGPDALVIGQLLEAASDDFAEKADVDAALPLLERAVRIYQKHYGPDYYRLGYIFRDMTMMMVIRDQLEIAKSLAERAVQILEKHFGDSNQLASAYAARYTVRFALGEDGAGRDIERVVSIFDKIPDPDYTTMILALGEYGTYLTIKGEFGRARQQLDRSKALAEEKFGPLHAAMVEPLSNLALLLFVQGDEAMAREHLERALKIAQTSVDVNSPRLVTTLQNLADIYSDSDPERALKLINWAEQAATRVFGPGHFRVGFVLLAKARILADRDDLAGAEQLAERCLQIFKGDRNVDHLGRGQTYYLKANLLRLQKDLAGSRAALQEALRYLERNGDLGSYIAVPLINKLGWLDMYEGNYAAAQGAFLSASNILDSHIRGTLWALSSAEQRLLLEQEVPQQVANIIASSHATGQLEQAYGVIFRWKGEMTHLLRRQTAIAGLRKDPARAPQVEQLQSVRDRLARWHYRAGTVSPEEWQGQLNAMTAKKEGLERELARALPPGALDDPLPGGLKDFQKLLKPDEVFVDIYLYDSRCGGCGSERYAAVVTGPAGAPALVDIGPSEGVNRAVFSWLNDTLSRRSADASWQYLTAILWKQLVKSLPAGTRKVWLSADADLSRVPWHLLPASDEQGRVLLLAQVDSAREVARLRRAPAAGGVAGKTLLLAGNVDFNAGPGMGATPSGWSFRSLNETSVEANVLQTLGRKLTANVVVLTGSRASEEAIKGKLPSASYAHLATHGFFARGMRMSHQRGSLPWGPHGALSAGLPRSMRNPLVESGIALAGANVRPLPAAEADGLLTAEEIVGLDLSKCELLTLSACETGRGEEVTGQGVMGLRASVMAAGARSMLMSLWKVPDRSAQKFMVAFYTNLWVKKLPKAEALLRAQESVRDDPSGLYKEPIHWAGWVLAGEGW